MKEQAQEIVDAITILAPVLGMVLEAVAIRWLLGEIREQRRKYDDLLAEVFKAASGHSSSQQH